MGASEWFILVPWQPDPAKALEAGQQQVLDELRKRWGDPSLTLDAVRLQAGEDGTGTILDIEQVASEPGFGCAAPLQAETLEQVFGTARATREAVEEHGSELASLVERWEAVYLPVLPRGRTSGPTEWCFIGCTGDGMSVLRRPRSDSGRFVPAPELRAVIGNGPFTRDEAVKRFWDYLGQHGLYDPHELRPDAAVAKVLGSKRVLRGHATFAVPERVLALLVPHVPGVNDLQDEPPAQQRPRRRRPKLRLVK